MKGEFKKKTGKIALVDLKKTRVSIEGIQRTKKDGTKVNVWFNPSNLQIQELDLEDKKRRMAIERTNANKKSIDNISNLICGGNNFKKVSVPFV